MCGNDNSIGYAPAESSVSVLGWSTLPRVANRPRFATGKIGEPDYASALPLDAESRKAVMDGFNNFCLWHGVDFAGVACGKDSAKIVNVSQVKAATNEELGLKFECHNAESSEAADIPDVEHPYMDETRPFSPAGQDKELPVDYRYRPTERQWQYHDFPCPWGGTLPPPMPPAGSEAMPSTESPTAREGDFLELFLSLERRFNRLSGEVKSYNDKIADLFSDVEMLKANSGSGPCS